MKVGSCKHSDVCTFSLHPLKSITSGEGGIVTTNNFEIAKNINLFRNHGISRNKKKHWEYDVLNNGYNYRLSDINCALGLSQLKKINIFIRERKKVYREYYFSLKKLNVKIPKYSNFIKPSFHLFFINLQTNRLKDKQKFIIHLKNNHILAQQHYIPIYKFKVYKELINNFSGAEKFFKKYYKFTNICWIK